MPRPQLWNAILIGALGLLFMGIAIIYPTTKSVIVGVETNGTTWNELNGASQPACTYASYYALPRSLLNHIACVISTSCQRLHRFITACANVTVFETVGLLPSPSWELPRLGGGVNQHILSGRSFITTLTENRACDSIVDYAERQACIKKVGQNDKIYVIVSIIVVVLACIGFAALIVRYVRCDHRAAALRKNDQPVSMVGLGRGLGSDAVGIRSSSSKSEQNKDSEKDLEKNSDELVASTWRVPAPRRNSTGWKHFLRGGPSASAESTENMHLALPSPSRPAPRIPAPSLGPHLPSSETFFSESARARMAAQRKPLNGMAAFEHDEFVVPHGLVIPEIRVISAGSY